MIKMKKRRFVLLICVIVMASLLTGICACVLYEDWTGRVIIKKSDYETLSDMNSKYAKLYALQTTISDQYLWDVDEDAEMEAAYKALVDSLGDKYSSYMTAEEYEEWINYVSGTFTGVGIIFAEDKDSGDYTITQILSGGPADKAGLKKGDVILKVDGEAYSDSQEVAAALQGEEGTQVKVTYQRGSKTKTVKMVRAQVEEPSVYARVLDEDYGYIRITAFESSTADQFKTELAAMEKKSIKGLIIDLRNNPGGFMEQGIQVADMLLPECTITHTEDKDGETEYYNSDESCTKLNYVLLVNENTASSAEILAAAVKDNQGGKLVGTTTFGKGIIQGTVKFKDGSALKMTIMQYFSPKNEEIQGVGVKPDYTVKQSSSAKTDKQLKKAMALLDETL